MNLDLFNSELCLTHAVPIRLLSAKGLRVVCTDGVVWLTVDGEPGDVFLKAGDSHRIRGDGLALLEGIGNGRVRFEKMSSRWPGVFLAHGKRLLEGLQTWPWRHAPSRSGATV